MKNLKEYRMGGISFFIPYTDEAADEFTKDIMPVDEPEEENGSDEAARFNAWMEQQAANELNDLQ